MELLHKLYDLLRHLSDDDKWKAMIDYIGLTNLYILLFAIVFCETGLVIWPFLPGDSLIFAIGAVAGRQIGINPLTAGILLIIAALTGDNVNYWLGRKLGPAVFRKENSKLFTKKHLLEAQSFYEKYGGKTIILARFVPIVRTFAPFVAGIGKMDYARFLIFSVIGASSGSASASPPVMNSAPSTSSKAFRAGHARHRLHLRFARGIPHSQIPPHAAGFVASTSRVNWS